VSLTHPSGDGWETSPAAFISDHNPNIQARSGDSVVSIGQSRGQSRAREAVRHTLDVNLGNQVNRKADRA